MGSENMGENKDVATEDEKKYEKNMTGMRR